MKKSVSEMKLQRMNALRRRKMKDSEQGLTSVNRAESELILLIENYDPHNENRMKQLLDILRTKGGYYDGRFAKYRGLVRRAALEYEKGTHPI
jgi:hypothetical protein